MLSNKTARYYIPPLGDDEIKALERGAKKIEGLRADLQALKDQVPVRPHVQHQLDQQREVDRQVAEIKKAFNKLPAF